MSTASEIEREPRLHTRADDLGAQKDAEIALAGIKDQFPAVIEISDEGITGSVTLATLASVARSVVDKALNGWKQESGGIVPRMIGADSAVIGRVPETTLQAEAVQYVTDVSLLSNNTAQGTVYAVSVHKPGTAQSAIVPAVLKKSPIISIQDWKRLVALRFIKRIVSARARRGGNLSRAEFVMANRMLVASDLITNRRTFRDVISNIDYYIRRYATKVAADYSDGNNDAYVDAVGNALTSALAEAALSPFFDLAYGFFRTFDAEYFPDKTVAVFGPSVNKDFPVQVSVIQTLDGDIEDLAKTWMRNGSVLNPRRVQLFWAQMVFGMSTFQALLGGVHNDAHLGNFLYERVPANTVLYYHVHQWGEPVTEIGKGSTIYAIPTDGIVIKMIDYGRSSFKVGDVLIESKTHETIIPSYGSRNASTDLIRAAACFTRTFGREFYDDLSTNAMATGEAGEVDEFLDRVLTCSDGVRANPAILNCTINAEDEFLYAKGTPCTDAVPGDLFGFFDRYLVFPDDVPAGSIVYPIWQAKPGTTVVSPGRSKNATVRSVASTFRNQSPSFMTRPLFGE